MNNTTLYLGLDPTNFKTENKVIHCPIIRPIPRDFNHPKIAHMFDDIPAYTHIIFTSRVGVTIFFDCLKHHGYLPEVLYGKTLIAIGTATACEITDCGGSATLVAKESTQEGIIKLLAKQDLDKLYFFLPCSSLARPDLGHFLMIRRVRHQLCQLYDTEMRRPDTFPQFDEIDEIVFTSPSTVDAFQKIFGKIPKNKKLTSIGPITNHKLNGAI